MGASILFRIQYSGVLAFPRFLVVATSPIELTDQLVDVMAKYPRGLHLRFTLVTHLG